MNQNLPGVTLNVYVPALIASLAVGNVFCGLRPIIGSLAAAVVALALGFAGGWAMSRAAVVLRDQTGALTRLCLYGLLLAGTLGAAWATVPAWGELRAADSEVDLEIEPARAASVPVQSGQAPLVPPGPERSANIPENLVELIAEGQRRLRTEKLNVGECGGNGDGQAQCLCDYLLAVTDETGNITLVEAYEKQESSPAGYTVKVQIAPRYERACGTNPVIDVSHPPGQTVLAIRTVVKTAGKGSAAAVFTPFTDELNVPELRERGLAHWWGVVEAAHRELRDLRVESAYVKGALVADLIPAHHVFLLGIIENIGSLAPFGPSGSEEQRLREIQAVLVMYGANGADAFKWRVSRADAHGPLQFTPIFKNIAKQYSQVGLPSDDGRWIDGAKDHRMSVLAAFLHSDEEFRPLGKSWRVKLPEQPLLFGLYLAAGYNGSVDRVKKALENCSEEEWYAVTCQDLYGREGEGHWYLRKYLNVKPVFFDPRTHARLAETENAPAPEEGTDASETD